MALPAALPPTPLQREFPIYTRKARKKQQEGVVELHLFINKRGNVTDVKLLRGIPESDLNEAAIEAARQWKYSPARRGTERLEVWHTAAVYFSLGEGKREVITVEE